MSKQIDAIADRSESTYGFRVTARIGINSGSMTAGNIGGTDRFCYTVLGDSVNLAARFEAANKKYGSRIIIGESTRNAIEKRFFTRLIDITRVKGREQEEQLFELSGLCSETSQELIDAAKLFEEALFARQQGDYDTAVAKAVESREIATISGSKNLFDVIMQEKNSNSDQPDA